MILKEIEEKIENGNIILGSHIFCGAPMLTEAMAIAGFDFLWIDMEHTAIGVNEVLLNLIAAKSGGACSVVRIQWNDSVIVKPILDMGPDGIIFPYIRTADDVRKAIESCEYPPDGIRGYGPLRALDYGRTTKLDYVEMYHNKMWKVIQLEHIDAIENLEEILSVKGIDAYIFGPNDLAASVGLIGQTEHPKLLDIYDRATQILQNAGKKFGVSMAYEPEIVNQWIKRGAKILFCGSDVGYVYESATNVFEGLNNMKPSQILDL
ncbi:TPA: hypothetical protein GXZ34_05015 [bacterium]|nr:hypothetical protein [bacterium]